MNQLAFRYDESKNPQRAHIAGVPLRDLTTAEFDELPEHIQRSVKAANFYTDVRKVATKKAKDGE